MSYPKRLPHDKWPVLLETLYDIFASQRQLEKKTKTQKTNKSRATSLNGQNALFAA